MKKRQKDILENPRFNKPLSKEAARVRYERLSMEDRNEQVVQFENLAETKIKRAMAEGVFDNLPGKGQPIDLHGYYSLPDHLRVGYQMLKNSGYLPEEVRLKKEMELIKEQIQQCASEGEKQRLMKRLSETSQRFHFHMEYNKKFRKSLF